LALSAYHVSRAFFKGNKMIHYTLPLTPEQIKFMREKADFISEQYCEICDDNKASSDFTCKWCEEYLYLCKQCKDDVYDVNKISLFKRIKRKLRSFK